MGKFQVIVDADLAPILPRYLEMRREELVRLEQALDSGDGDGVRMLGHKLKGTGTSYGFPRLTELGAAIEIAGKTDDFTTAATLTAELRSYLENVEVVFDVEGQP